VKKFLTCVLFAYVVWLLLVMPREPEEYFVGLLFSLLIGTFVGEVYPERIELLLNPYRLFWLLCYVPVFFYYCIRANLDVAYRVLHVDMPIHPGIVKLHTTLQTDLAKTLLANSITLTPGTLTVDVDGSDLYIHWINVTTEDPQAQTEQIVRRFEGFLKRIFE